MPISFRARVVFPVDRPPIEHGVVTVEGERIVEVGTKSSSGEVTDLGSVALLPGLVNAHTHLEFSGLAQPLGKSGMSLVDWIRLVIAERGRSDRASSDPLFRGCHECVAMGVTTIGDIVTNPAWTVLDAVDATCFHEVIGFSRARAESALSGLVDRIDFAIQALAALGSDARVSIQQGISPHAPYTVSPRLLDELVALARKQDLPVAMHLAESREELQLLRDGTGPFQALLEERSMWDADAIPRGSRPLDYLQMLAAAPRTLVVHGNYLDDEELEFLANNRERMSLVYCPRTHAFFQHSPYPITKALAAGVRVALGTDSRASNPDLDLLAEIRFVAKTHSGVDLDETLRMGTLAGAEALGREGDVGSLTPGKLANMVAVPLPADARGGPQDLLAAMLSSELPVSRVWVRGECKVMPAE